MDRLYGEVGGRWVSAAFKKLSYVMQKKNFNMRKYVTSLLEKKIICCYLDLIYQENVLWRTN